MDIFAVPDIFRYILTLIGSYHRSKVCSVSTYWRDNIIPVLLYTNPRDVPRHQYSAVFSDYHTVARLKWLPWRALWYACMNKPCPDIINKLISQMHYNIESQRKKSIRKKLRQNYRNVSRRCIPILAQYEIFNDCIMTLIKEYDYKYIPYSPFPEYILNYKSNDKILLAYITRAAAMYHGNLILYDQIKEYNNWQRGWAFYWALAGGNEASIERISFLQNITEYERECAIDGALRECKEKSMTYIRKYHNDVVITPNHIYSAIRYGQLDSLQYIFEEGRSNRDINYIYASKCVASSGNLATMRYLQTVKDINASRITDQHIYDYLGIAVVYANMIFIEEYLSECQNKERLLYELFCDAARYSHETFKYLLDHYGDTLSTNAVVHLLTMACQMNNARSAKLLLPKLSETDIMSVLVLHKQLQTQFLIRVFGQERVYS